LLAGGGLYQELWQTQQQEQLLPGDEQELETKAQ
jgi:hypothetical protein